ncbi:phage virion morphogenesis protein [Methylobacterium aquaticum]|uniref:phage virion morphogenesis protein n=1 Tax=Methylobacterium aquaticum TaxID=270351 RepID=UPI001933B7CA|nr:phage virion morphogenesis protein [Methylobacterium aquaticum]QRE74386.1 phage virion morphogenesis protein [Methylobacterium aquaticum]
MDAIGVSITIDASEFGMAADRLRQFVSFDPAPLMEEIAALGESQTRRRISEEKTAPDGTPWEPNRNGTPILTETGQHLLASVAFYASSEEAVWGAAWEFAHIHQEGAVIAAKNAPYLVFFSGGAWHSAKSVTIPARPFVGLSDDNRAEIEDLVSDHFGRLR